MTATAGNVKWLCCSAGASPNSSAAGASEPFLWFGLGQRSKLWAADTGAFRGPCLFMPSIPARSGGHRKWQGMKGRKS